MSSKNYPADDLKEVLLNNFKVYQLFEDLINSYVSDYYVEEHWKKLPNSWKSFFQTTSLDKLAELLDYSHCLKHPYPLSLLSLRKFLEHNVLSRKNIVEADGNNVEENVQFMKLFWKGVKLKKRHEIDNLAKLCCQTALKTNCFNIVDVGAGMGHLSRLLCYKYGFKVCTLEANNKFSLTAEQIDLNFEKEVERKHLKHRKVSNVVHITKKITCDINNKEFCTLIQDCLEIKQFGIVGLHPCGNLATTLLKLYNECENIKFINIASCCYMKMTLNTQSVDFPLSKHCKNHNFKLSYLAGEVACHSIENYLNNLRTPEEYNKLKIHSYRAGLEKILVTYNNELKHSIVNSVKFYSDLTFKKYCDKILNNFNIRADDSLISACEELVERTWKDVIVFYSLRLLLAPLIESIILQDRLLFLYESGSDVKVIPAFDCVISPRNNVITACKK